jgi:DNA-binding HxlR family transcriptional regulator
MRSGPPVGQPGPIPEAATLTSAYTTLSLLDGKWALVILALLATEPRRHTDIIQALSGQVSGKVLTQTMARMRDEGLVARTVDKRQRSGPYTLTARGRSLYRLVTALAEWADAEGKQSDDDPSESE